MIGCEYGSRCESGCVGAAAAGYTVLLNSRCEGARVGVGG